MKVNYKEEKDDYYPMDAYTMDLQRVLHKMDCEDGKEYKDYNEEEDYHIEQNDRLGKWRGCLVMVRVVLGGV